MRPLVTPEKMGRADRAAIDAGTPVEVLMDRAGRAVARAVIDLLGSRYGRKAVVVCGKGNNGGDGFVAARVLRGEGLGVRCLLVGDEGEVEGAPRHYLEMMRQRGIVPEPFDARHLAGADAVIDAIFGTGFRGQASGEAATAIEAIDATSAPVVSIDIPSGVNGATGAVEGPAVTADVTVVMAAEKIGTAIGQGALNAGDVIVADIGIPVTSDLSVVEGNDVAAVLPSRTPDAHKRSRGAVAFLAGSDGMSGAAILAARGAVRMGAGYATVGVTREVDPIVSAALPEVLTRIVTDEAVLGPEALEAFKPVLERAGAVAIGPGIGEGESQRSLVDRVLSEVELPVVVDADGLNVLAGTDEALVQRKHATVITPHPGELARLMATEAATIQSDRVGAARSAAERFGCTVLLKGHRSVVASGGAIAVIPTGGPALATAGTGDVLTGAIAALLTAGLGAFEATWAAAYIHGLAGDLAESGAVAWDIAEGLPDAIALVHDIASEGPRNLSDMSDKFPVASGDG